MRGLVLLTVVLQALTAFGAVAGIDFGSEFIKVALVKPSSFDIVVDEQSKRKVPAIVAFDTTERAFGNNAASLVVRNAANTFMWVHRLIGRTIDSPEVKELQEEFGLPYKFVEIPGRQGAVGIQHGDEILAPEELLAMSLEHIKKICDEDAGAPVKDAVITVPAYWAQNQRAALINAAELAGFHVLSLINQNTAAAVQYAIDRKFNATDPPHKLIIYNMGATSTEASLVTYTSYLHKQSKKKNVTVGQFEVEGHTYDSSLGGAFFDVRIANYLKGEWDKLYPDADISQELRPMAKIRKQAVSVKKVLSANTGTPVFIQSLFNDVDYKAFITREQFNEISLDLVDRVTAPLDALLESKSITKDEIDGMVIVGGAVRIPAVQSRLREWLGRDLLQNLNGDEAFALGAAFRGANLSTAFQPRKMGMTDVASYPVGIRLSDLPIGEDAAAAAAAEEEGDEDGEAPKKFTKRASLFSRHGRVGKRKTVAFTHDKDFLCTMHYDKATLLPSGSSAEILYYNVTGLGELVADQKNAALLAEQKPRVAISFSLSSSGTVSLAKAEATLEEMVQVVKPKPKKKAPGKEDTEEGKKGEDAAGDDKKEEEEKKEEDVKEEVKEEVKDESKEESKEEGKEESKEEEGEGKDTAEDEDKAAEEEEGKEEEEEEIEYEMVKKTHRFPLKIALGFPETILLPMNAAMTKNATKRLSYYLDRDQMQIKIATAKNGLESRIYAVRDKLWDEAIEEVSTEEQREAITALCGASEEWLYEQADDDYQKFDDKLDEINALFEPMSTRAFEAVARPDAVNQTKTLIAYTRKMVADMAEKQPWLPEEDKDKLLAMVDEVEGFLTNQTLAQEALEPHQDPAFRASELTSQLRPVAKFSARLLKRPKPKPKVDKKKKVKKNATATEEPVAEEEAKEGAEPKVEEQAEAAGDDTADAGNEEGQDEGKEEGKEAESEAEL